MISKIHSLPDKLPKTAESIKIQNLFTAYPDTAQLFVQDKTGGIILVLSKDAIISGNINTEEVRQFLSFLRPNSVFSSTENLCAVFGNDCEEFNVLICEKPPANSGNNVFTCDFSSRQAYDMLLSGGFTLPDYEYFAADYCRRKNHGLIKVFGKADSCIAITLEADNCRLLSGIVSKKKGLGGALLLSAVKGDKPVLAVCRDELVPFYIKYGFSPLYKAGCWRK